jgi:hypothetical protein
VTYVSGGVYYISLGSQAGLSDSTRVAVVGKGGDTVATLVVFAVSSKSSACRLAGSTRSPVVGDVVIAPAGGSPSAGQSAAGFDSTAAALSADSAGARPGAAGAAAVGVAGAGIAGAGAPPSGNVSGADAVPGSLQGQPETAGQSVPWIRVRGRLTAQYNTYIVDSTSSTLTQPSLSANLRGDLSGAPIRFEFAGIVRSTVTGTSAPFGPGGVGRSRLYRLSVEFNDNVNRVGVGRILPFAGLPAGYVDGLVASHKFGIVEVGGAAGFEPDYRYQHPVTNRRKLLGFAGAGSADPFTWSAGASYARTFLESSVERSVASASAMAVPSRAVSFSAQSEVDFRFVRNGTVQTKARLSSLLAQVNVRVIDEVSVGAGVVSWRPVYPISTVEEVPDSMKDDRLWVTPSVSLRIYPGGGFSVSEQYSTRSRGEGFGDDYSNLLSVGYENIARSGLGLRATQTLNHTSIAVSTGFGAAVRRMFGDLVEAGLRYQYYRNEYASDLVDDRTDSYGLDLNLPVTSSLYLMLTGELAYGTLQDYRLLNGSLSWRF